MNDLIFINHRYYKQHVERYRNLAAGAEEVESQLSGCFAEHLNAEIVLQTIRDVAMAIEWLKSTFLYVRVSFNNIGHMESV